MPEVTVLLTVYNGERYLREAIESILAQTFRDFEFLIVNDGSTDGTRAVIMSYDDPRIRLIDNRANLGQTPSLNRGLQLAAGHFVARQDADDISEPERLAKQLVYLQAHPEVALLGTWYTEIDAAGAALKTRPLPCECIDIRWSLLFFCPFVHSAVMLRRAAVLTQVGFYDEAFSYAQDHDFWHRIARRLPVANLAEPLVKVRIHPWSMTATYGERVEEGVRSSVAHLGHLLDWDNRNRRMNEVKFTQLTSLLFEPQVDFRPQDAHWAAEELLRLSAAFYRYYKMGKKERRTHRAKLRAHVSSRLIDIAYYHLGQNDRTTARRLLTEAYRQYWPAVLAKKSVRLSLHLLMGPRLVRIAKRLTQTVAAAR